MPRLADWGPPTCALLALSWCLGGCGRSPVPSTESSPGPPAAQPAGGTRPEATAFEATGGIDPKVVASWEQAGARFGWEVPVYGDYSSQTPLETTIVPRRPAEGPALPAFSAAERHVRGLPDLPPPQAPFALDLRRSPLTDAELIALARFQHLQSLTLIDVGIQDHSLEELGHLRQLQILSLGGNRITDAGLKALAGLEALKMISLGATNIRGPGLKELGARQKLRTLRLYGLNVPNAVWRDLAELRQLRVLDLHLTNITDAGLRELARLKELELLNVALTGVTDAGLAAIRKELPRCRVQR
jgi:hypothetical protein